MKKNNFLNYLGIVIFIIIISVLLLSITDLIPGQFGDFIITISGVIIGIILLISKRKKVI